MKGKKWIFFAPCSNQIAQNHFKDTILKGRKFEDILEYLNESEKKILNNRDPLRIWRNTPGSRSQRMGYMAMEPGDVIFFYQNRKFFYAGKVYHKTESEELAKKL